MARDVETLAPELERYREPLLRLARGLLRRWPSIDPDDPVQTTFEQAIERPPANIDNLERWLRGILRHRVIDAMRKATQLACDQLPSDKPDTGPSPSGGAKIRELNRQITDALAQLPRRHRDAVELTFFFEWTQAEVAEYLGCTRPAVAGLIRTSIKWLRELLPELLKEWSHVFRV